MCGIAGCWSATQNLEALRDLLQRQCAALAHRGPDASGVFVDPAAGLGLAHTRLAILDLSPNGAQPMRLPGSPRIISYNGEVYNYAALRAELDAAGATPQGGWRGGSDTEVLLAGIDHFGLSAAMSRWIGMFAMAVWDEAVRELTLVRDRLGIKPLYVGFAGPDLVFGSELKALMAHPGLERRVDPGALALYTRFQYVPEPHCIFQGIRKLPPGTFLRIRPEHLAARRLPEPEPYWSAMDAAARGLADPLPADEVAVLERLEALLGDAVGLRMIADVPLGAFLSGGIDSSTVVALMQARSTAPVRTFSIGFAEGEFNEADQARAVAAHLGCDHTELVLAPDETLAVIPELPQVYDEPFADVSQIPTWLVSRLARQHVTVSLSGDGGDELFWGYVRHTAAPALWSKAALLPRGLRSGLAALARGPVERLGEAAYGAVSRLLAPERRQAIFRDKLQKVVEALDAPDREGFYRSIASTWTDTMALTRAREPVSPISDPALRRPEWDFTAWMAAMDLVTYLPGDILTKVDRASMAHALEARVPILDHRVVELAWRIPAELKVRGTTGKWLLRRLLAKYVPDTLLAQPKRGFAVPLADWLRGPLREWAGELCSPSALAETGLFAAGPVRQVWREHMAGARNHQQRLWTVCMAQAWARSHL